MPGGNGDDHRPHHQPDPVRPPAQMPGRPQQPRPATPERPRPRRAGRAGTDREKRPQMGADAGGEEIAVGAVQQAEYGRVSGLRAHINRSKTDGVKGWGATAD